MPDRTDLWYRLGYAIESARQGQARAALDAPDEVRPRGPENDARSPRSGPVRGGDDARALPGSLDLLVAVGTGSLLTRLLRSWTGRGTPPATRLLRAAAAGVGATALRRLLVPFLTGADAQDDADDAVVDRLLAGAARGLLHAALTDPRLPGPPALRGAGYGVLEYLLTPWGGVGGVAGHHAPWRRVPLVSPLLDRAETGEESLVDHLAFGVMLGLLYGDDESSRIGIGIEER